jgi:hypothetical protein
MACEFPPIQSETATRISEAASNRMTLWWPQFATGAA